MDLDGPSVSLPLPAPPSPARPAMDPWMIERGGEGPPRPRTLLTGRELVREPTAVLYAEMERRGPACSPGPEDPIGFENARKAFRDTFGYAIPTPRAVARIAEFAGPGGVCEIGAGRALWARLLGDHGIAVDATDHAIEEGGISKAKAGYFDSSPHVFHPVRCEFARRAAEATDAKTLMMVWPPYGLAVASLSLAAFRGDRLVYIGEDRHGCTGDDAFFDLLDAEWQRVGGVGIPNWGHLSDRVHLYRRCPLGA